MLDLMIPFMESFSVPVVTPGSRRPIVCHIQGKQEISISVVEEVLRSHLLAAEDTADLVVVFHSSAAGRSLLAVHIDPEVAGCIHLEAGCSLAEEAAHHTSPGPRIRLVVVVLQTSHLWCHKMNQWHQEGA